MTWSKTMKGQHSHCQTRVVTGFMWFTIGKMLRFGLRHLGGSLDAFIFSACKPVVSHILTARLDWWLSITRWNERVPGRLGKVEHRAQNLASLSWCALAKGLISSSIRLEVGGAHVRVIYKGQVMELNNSSEKIPVLWTWLSVEWWCLWQL
jgi:hypothetical protein